MGEWLHRHRLVAVLLGLPARTPRANASHYTRHTLRPSWQRPSGTSTPATCQSASITSPISLAALKGQHLPPVLHLRRAWGSLCANRQALQFGSEFRASGYHRRHAYSRCLCGSHGKSTSAIVCKSRKSSQITTAILDRSSYGYGTEATLSRMSADLDLKPPTRMRCGAFA